MQVQVLFALLLTLLPIQPAPPVPYPDGYRTWNHVKSTLVGPTHPRFADIGGFQHFYANDQALQGYRSGTFPEGSVLVVDWLALTAGEQSFEEGSRRQIDVMVRDSTRYAPSGGWGFQRFMGDSHDELATTPTPDQCFACHTALAKDGLVLGTYRE